MASITDYQPPHGHACLPTVKPASPLSSLSPHGLARVHTALPASTRPCLPPNCLACLHMASPVFIVEPVSALSCLPQRSLACLQTDSPASTLSRLHLHCLFCLHTVSPDSTRSCLPLYCLAASTRSRLPPLSRLPPQSASENNHLLCYWPLATIQNLISKIFPKFQVLSFLFSQVDDPLDKHQAKSPVGQRMDVKWFNWVLKICPKSNSHILTFLSILTCSMSNERKLC